MKRAVIYARVSRAYKEDDERVTIEAQLNDCRDYCLKHGYQVIGEFVDKDKYRARKKLVNPSGTRKDRPGYVAMLRAARASEFEVIIAWKEDRLYRGAYAAIPLSETIDETRGLSVELVKEQFDFKMLGIKAAIGKIEIDNIRDRMVMGRRMRIERGETPGGPVRYGYYKGEGNRLFIYEPEAGIVQQVFEWYINGENSMEIRRRLNAKGIPPRINKIWSKDTIQNIITFDGYASGVYETTLDGEKFSVSIPPIISMSTWQKAVDVRAENKRYRGRNVKEDYLCRGMVVCPCGWHWNVRTSRGPTQKYGTSGYYGCARKDQMPEKVHPDCPGTIGAKKLDAYVWNFIVAICENPDIIQRAIDQKIQELQADRSSSEDEVEGTRRELNRLEEERQWVITKARKGIITEKDLQKQLAMLQYQTNELDRVLNESLAGLAVQQQAILLKAWADNYFRDVAGALKVLAKDPVYMSPDEQTSIFEMLEGGRYMDKFNGDALAALRWAILEEKRRTVRKLISHVMVVKGPSKEKKIIPFIAFAIPLDFASLVYDDESLAYIEQTRKFAEEQL